MRLHVHSYGDPDAPPLVCLHGVTGHAERFRRLAEERLGFCSEIAFEDGMRDLLVWLEGQEAVDAMDAAREALVARGLAH